MSQSTICLIIFALTLVCYIINKFPLALVSMTSLIALTVTGCLSSADALAQFSKDNIIIMGAMMVIAAGLNRTQMIHKVTNLVYKVSGESFTKGMIGYCLITFAISQTVASAIVIFTICAPLVSDFCRKSGKSPSAGLFSCALIAISSVVALPIGSGAANYITTNQTILSYGLVDEAGNLLYEAHMFDYFIVKIPSLVIALVCGIWVCPRLAPDHGALEDVEQKKYVEKEMKPLAPFQEVCGYGIFVVVVICMLFSTQLSALGIKTWYIAFIGALLELFCGVLTEREALQGIMLSPIFLAVGALALGVALVNTGAGALVSTFVQSILGSNPNPWIVTIVLWLTAFIMTQFMSNMALNSALAPVVYLLCQSYGWNPIGLGYMVMTACFISYLTPLSTVAVPYMMGIGGYTQKDLLRMGWIPALLITVTTVPWVMLVQPPC